MTDNLLLTQSASLIAMWLVLALMMFGPANKHNANDNTSGVVTLLEIAKALPIEQRSKVCFVLFDLEEAGLIGSASYYNTHRKAAKQQLMLNLDCVGDGNEIMFFPSGKLKKDKRRMDSLDRICGHWGEKNMSVRKKGFSVYPSDQGHFPYGVGIAALHKGPFGLYLSRIHTHRDTVMEEENVKILCDGLVQLISGTAAE